MNHDDIEVETETETETDLPATVTLAARWSDLERRRAVRQQHRLTQREIASHLGVTQTAVQRWETGRRNPRGDDAQRYFQFLTWLEQLEQREQAD